MRTFLRSVCIAAMTIAAGAAGSRASDPITGDVDQFPVPPGVAGGSVGAFLNPASWAALYRPEAVFLWDDRNERGGLDNWGVSVGKNLGFSALTRTYARYDGIAPRVTDYQIGLAGGDQATQVGVSWRWSGGDTEILDRSSGIGVGIVRRPVPFLSVGATGFLAGAVHPEGGQVDAGVRPFGDVFTLYGDVTGGSGVQPRWGGGLEVRPVPGLQLGGMVRQAPNPDDGVQFGFRIGVTLDRLHIESGGSYAEGGGDHVATRNQIRVAPPFRGMRLARAVRSRQEPDRVVPISLEHRLLTYRRDKWFDNERVAWLDFARYLDEVQAEPSVKGVVFNIAGLRGRPSLIWELRERFLQLRASGKTVTVYADRLSMGMMWLASAADTIWLDPEGHIMLQGVALQRTYMAGLLEKLGLGAEEWRYLTYKSAFETYTRTTMSDADRVQYQRVADVIYETWRDGIAEGRKLAPAAVDGLVNDEGRIRPEAARTAGLVDFVGRWPDLVKNLKAEPGTKIAKLPPDDRPVQYPDDQWGLPPAVAVVYTLGSCSMDEGIRGRATSKYLNALAKSKRVKAVVLRVDSPGGDPLPSDLVDEGVRRIRAAGKPVVISQGDVAASGGYWISMNGTEILTTPLTVTGSIGVIAGWVWDEGFGDKVGFSADGVQRGIHADLFAGIRFPMVGYPLPLRNLTPDEKAKAREQILSHYDTFVSKVASGRGMGEDAVRAVAEGRVWMGGDAIDRKLCDKVGGLGDAVTRAKELAGLPGDKDVEIIEYPPQRAFRWPNPYPEIPKVMAWMWGRGEDHAEATPSAPDPWLVDYGWLYLRSLAGAQGAPLALTPPEALPDGWYAED